MLWKRIQATLRGRQLDDDISDELRSHVDMRADELIASGVSADEARRQARLAFGHMETMKEDARSIDMLQWVEALLQDTRYAVRTLRKSFGFTTVAVVTLALGIGANTAIFSMMYQVMFRPLPFANPDQLVRVITRWRVGYGENVVPAIADAVAQRTTTLSSVAVGFPSTGCNLVGGSTLEYVRDKKVSANFFQTLGVQPALGRAFLTEDATPGGSATALISYSLWQRQFGGDPNILGRHIDCNGRALTIIGVLPRELARQFEAQVWTADRLAEHLGESGMNYTVVARVKPGVSTDDVQRDLDRIFVQVRAEHPGRWWTNERARGPGWMRYRDLETGQLRKPLMVLLVAVALVLLIACANIAGLLLARTTARAHEISLRAALGAGRMRIVRQMLTEALVLNVLGGIAGVALGWGLMSVIKRLIPANTTFFGFTQADVRSLQLNWVVLLVTFAVALLTGLLCGLGPSLAASGADPISGLRLTARGGGLSRGHQLSRKLLLTGQVAVSLVLLVCASEMVRSFLRLQQVDLGFDPNNLQVAQLSFGSEKFKTPEAVWNFEQKVTKEIAALPGVTQAAAVSSPPLGQGLNLGAPDVDGKQCPDGALDYRAVTPTYFDTMRIPVVRGRAFTDSDVAGGEGVIVINAAMARQCWPNKDPIGQQVWMSKADRGDIPRQIVGVVGDVKEYAVDQPSPPMVYVPQAQVQPEINELLYGSFGLLSGIVVRTSRPVDLSIGVQRAIEAVDPEQPVARISPMSQTVSESITSTRLLMILMTAFAVLAVVLTATGVYGLLAYYVAQRRQEIGIRIAIGAARSSVMKLVIGQGVAFVLIGAAIGLAGAVGATRLLASLTFGIGKNDPISFVTTVVLLVAIALLASYIPARRALSVDPMIALRND